MNIICHKYLSNLRNNKKTEQKYFSLNFFIFVVGICIPMHLPQCLKRCISIGMLIKDPSKDPNKISLPLS